MVEYDYNAEKNYWLKENRDVSFEEVIAALDSGALLDIIDHPNKDKYPNQRMYVLRMNAYLYLVPFVKKNSGDIFLKTIFRSRKMLKQYVQEMAQKEEVDDAKK